MPSSMPSSQRHARAEVARKSDGGNRRAPKRLSERTWVPAWARITATDHLARAGGEAQRKTGPQLPGPGWRSLTAVRRARLKASKGGYDLHQLSVTAGYFGIRLAQNEQSGATHASHAQF